MLCNLHWNGLWRPGMADPDRINITGCICDTQKWPNLPCRTQCCHNRAFLCNTRRPFMLEKEKIISMISRESLLRLRTIHQPPKHNSLLLDSLAHFRDQCSLTAETHLKHGLLFLLISICGFPLIDSAVVGLVSGYGNHFILFVERISTETFFLFVHQQICS